MLIQESKAIEYKAVSYQSQGKTEQRVIRLQIVLGILFLVFFLALYIQRSNVGYLPLYWLLTLSMSFKLLRMLHEWYHYWNIQIPITPPLTEVYSVDVLTTFCAGEPYEMIITTLKAIQAIEYPHTTYLCDEANDPYLKAVCKELGIVHVTRTLKINAKAGNINNALQQAKGEICLVLDPDHIPAPNFLDRVLPFFRDAQVGFVQCVQAYYNRKESLVAYGAAEQTYHFYGPMMMSMGKYGTAQAIGANCTFRRSALDSIGGHAAGLSEDMHTAMRLHAKGWKSVYVPEPLSRGLVPGTLAAYYKQQIKWSRGTFELLFVTFPQLFKQFTWRQKLHYFSIPLYYLFGLFGLIDLLIPVLALSLLQLPLRMDLADFAVAYAPLFVTSLLIRQYAQRWLIEKHEAGFHMIGGILRSGTWWVYLLGLIYTLFRVKVPYIPTPKNDQPKNNFWLCLPNILGITVTLGSLVYGAWSYGRLEIANPYYQIMIVFALMNIGILGLNVLVGQEKFLVDTYRFIQRQTFNASLVMPLRLFFWRTRYRFYGLIRSKVMSASLTMLLIVGGYLVVRNNLLPKATAERSLKKGTLETFYVGAYASDEDSTRVLERIIKKTAEKTHSILAFRQPWELNATEPFSAYRLNVLAKQEAIPLIRWELTTSAVAEKEDVLQAIRNGQLDAYLRTAANQIKNYRKDVFVSFAPEPDNPMQTWLLRQNNPQEAYIQTWRYVIDFFRKADVTNVIWVWEPWKETGVEFYYPGSAYVDWVGVRCLNYGWAASDGTWHSFETLYEPYRRKFDIHPDEKLHEKPVLLTAFGSAGYGGDAIPWMRNAVQSIEEKYPEIRSLVFYHPTQDILWPTRWRPQAAPPFVDWVTPDSVTQAQLTRQLSNIPYRERSWE